MTFRQGAQHRRCRSLTFAWTITPDCERHELWNRADIFFVPIRESMLKSFVSYKTFLVRSQKGKKKCVSKDIFCSPTTIVDDDNNKHRCRQCPSNPEHFPKVRTTYIHSYSTVPTTTTSSSHKNENPDQYRRLAMNYHHNLTFNWHLNL